MASTNNLSRRATVGACQAAVTLLVWAAATAAFGQVSRNTRADVLPSSVLTSDDPQRIPIRPPSGKAPQLVLKGGRVFDSLRPAAYAGTVVLEGRTIKAILPPDSADWASDATVIDITGKTVMPGLIDLHVHMTYPDPDTPIDEQDTEGSGVLRGERNLRWFLESGFTSVRDLGGVLSAPYQLSQWSAAGRIPAPRIFAAGHIITGTGGHATERPVSANHGPAYTWERDGPDAWRAAVRLAFKQGASVIKVASHFTFEEVAAAVDEAHALGLPVTCDCETIYTERAVAAGVDMIEHPLPRTAATIATMGRKNIAAVPTLQVYQNVLDTVGGFYGSTSRRFSMSSQSNFDMFKALKAAGIVMGVGTDTIGRANTMTPNPYIAELKWFVKGGYTPAQALIAATRTNAELLAMGDRLGTLEPGKLADVIVVDGRPDQVLDDLIRVDAVIKDGRLWASGGKIVIAPHAPAPLSKPSPPEATR